MKTFLQTLLFFLMVMQICFAQMHNQTKVINLKTPAGMIALQDKALPKTARDFHRGISHQLETTKFKKWLQNGFYKSSAKSVSFSLRNELNKSPFPTHGIQSLQSQINVLDTALVISEHDTTRHLYSYNAKAKRTSDLNQKLIGGYWVDTWRHTNTYDDNNMLTSLYETWDNSQWVIIYLGTYTYDAQGNMLTDWYEYWENGQVRDIFHYTYTYDVQGNMLTELYEYWESGQLMSSERHTYTYDSQGKMLTGLTEIFEDGQWLNYRRENFTYDAQGNMLIDLYENWENSQWVICFREANTYDAQSNILTHAWESWVNSQWVIYHRETYTYDTQGNTLTYLYEFRHNDQLINSARDTYTYDAQGNMLIDLYEIWEDDDWVKYLLLTNTYDVQGEILTGLVESWENGQWVNYHRTTFIYDTQENLTSFWNHQWFDSSWIPIDVGGFGGFEVTDIGGNEYHFYGYNFTFIYKLIITEIVSESGNTPEYYSLLQNYPNPFNPSTTIEFSLPNTEYVTLKIYNLLGQEVTTLVSEKLKAGNYKYTWDAGSLASGVYLYQLQVGEYVETKKLVLMK